MSIDRLAHNAAATPWPAALLAVAALAITAALAWATARALRHIHFPPGSVIVAAVAAAGCTAYSADTSWGFARDWLGMHSARERVGMFAAAEVALLACAIMARANKQATASGDSAGTPGVPGVLVWVVTGVQVIPAYAESGPVGGTVRAIVGPVLAGLLWHLAMGLEIRVARPAALSTGLAALIGRELRERLLSYLGLATRDRTAEQITRDRAMARAVRLASRPKLRGWGRRRLAAAVARARVGTDGAQRHRLLQELAARRTSSELATVPLPSPWASTGVLAEPYPRTPLGVTGAQLRSMDPLEAVLQVHAAHPQQTAGELAATCTEYGVPVTETLVRIALRARTPEPELAVPPKLVLAATPTPQDVPEPAVPDGEYTASGLHLDLVTEPEVRPEFACATPAVAAAQPRTRAEVHARVPDVPAGFADGADRVLDEIAKDRTPRADRSRTRPRVRPVPARQKKAAAAASPADQLARARELDAEHRRLHGRPASIRALKTGLRVGQPRAEQLRALLDEGAQS
jgi:hypothetical protein